MQGIPTTDEQQLGATRWLAALALAVSVVALIVIVAMAWTLTPAHQKRIEPAKAREGQAKALLARRSATSGRDDSGSPPTEPAAQDPVAQRAHPATVNER